MLEVVLTNAFGEHMNKDTQVFDYLLFGTFGKCATCLFADLRNESSSRLLLHSSMLTMEH